MTLSKIAKMAGVTLPTVSKAFSGSKEISEKTKERIFDIAKELGCFDKFYKAPRKNPLIAILIPEIESEAYASYSGIFEKELHSRSADVMIVCTRFDNERAENMFRALAYDMKVDGVISWSYTKTIKNPDEIPLISFTRSSPEANADHVSIDIYGAFLTLVKKVKEYGHKDVGFIGEALSKSREEAFKKAMRQVGLPLHQSYVYTTHKRFAEAGKDGMRYFIENGKIPSVIITAYDQIAYGAMKYAREVGLKIPDDVSFAGTDDIISAPYFDVPLTSIHIGYENICKDVCDLLFSRIENRHCRMKKKITIPVEVNIRDSLLKLKTR